MDVAAGSHQNATKLCRSRWSIYLPGSSANAPVIASFSAPGGGTNRQLSGTGLSRRASGRHAGLRLKPCRPCSDALTRVVSTSSHGAAVVLVSPERSADRRRHNAKYTKSDRLDSQLLARLPMLHPDGLYPEQGLGPGDALKRAAKLHSTLTHRRSQSVARLDALLEILGPGWHAAIGGDVANRTPLRFLAAGYADPHVVKRLGRTRLARFCYRHSRGAWGEPHADALLTAARHTLELWADGDLEDPTLPRTSRSRPGWRCS